MKAKQIEIALRNLDKLKNEIRTDIDSYDMPMWFQRRETKVFFESVALSKLMLLDSLAKNTYDLEKMSFIRGQIAVIDDLFTYENRYSKQKGDKPIEKKV